MDEDRPASEDLETTRAEEPPIGTPQQIGRYRLLQRLGEGGMGEVWEAEQEEPVRRRVALKLIKWGMDSKAVVARFESERQALALMDHPSIARVFDAGATRQGRPYFAMEYVKGVPITDYCDTHKLDTEQRLGLFIQVCEGVQHAHHKGIIHRDIKASNVLVGLQDSKPVPKIIDFGVAKATQQRLTERTVFTELGQLIGTPEYMSPEQAELTGLDIDTRTDVYSLGVLLYKLLAGVLPFDSMELRKAGFDGFRRVIREQEPPRPSAKVSTLDGETSGRIADHHRTDPRFLVKELRGDLDWIVMKALEKDRTRRYGSPNEFAEDIRRHLKHEPIVARPPSVGYRARKFVRRHRLGVAFALAATLLLAGFAARERIQATTIVKERDRANKEAATARQALEFMTSMFEISDPSEARGNSITAREILDKGAKEIEERLGNEPEVQARLMATMGSVYWKLGLFAEAESLLDRALDIRKRVLGHEHSDTLDGMYTLANLYVEQGRFDEAEPLYLQTLDVQKRVLGHEHIATVASIHSLAILYRHQGRYDAAEPLELEVHETRKRLLGDDHPSTLKSAHELAILYGKQGRFDEAELLFLETLDVQKRVLGHDHPNTVMTMGSLAALYDVHGRFDEAERLYLDTLDEEERVLGHDHPRMLYTLNNLAELYRSQGRFDEAEPLYLESLEGKRRVLGDEHYRTATTIHNLACLKRETGRYEDARRMFERAQRIWEDQLGPHHPYVAENLEQHAKLLRKMGDEEEATRLETRAKAIRQKS